MSQQQEVKYLPEDNFYNTYAEKYEQSSSGLTFQLYNVAELENMDNILEVGAGTGHMLPTIIQRKKKSANYTAIDIQHEFLQAQQQRVEFLEKMGNFGQVGDIPKFQIVEQPKKEKHEEMGQPFDYQNKKFNVNLKMMDVHNLQIQDNTYDGYFATFVLHHANWRKSFKECHRILKQGGRICLAEFGEDIGFMWGNTEKTNQLLKKMFGDKFQEKKGGHHHHHHGEDQQQGHDHHHDHDHKENKEYGHDNYEAKVKNNLLNQENIQESLKELGFKDIQIWEQYVPIKRNFFMRDGFLKEQFENGEIPECLVSEEEQNKIMDEIQKEMERPRKSSKASESSPPGFMGLCVVATKI